MSRLSVAASVLAVALALVVGTILAPAQEATPAAVPPPLEAWAAAWEAGDIEGILATYTDDAVFEEVPLGVVTRGQDELRAHLEGLMSAFPDFSLKVTDAFVAGDWAAVEWTVTGTYSGQFPGLPPGAGQPVSIRGSSILELEDGLVRADREYWDAYGFLVQLGALPAPGAAATPAP